MNNYLLFLFEMVVFDWQTSVEDSDEPVYPVDDIYGIVGDNLKKSYDIRQVQHISFSNNQLFCSLLQLSIFTM